MSLPARSRWILAAVLLVSVVIVWRVRRHPPQYSAAYISDRQVTLWSTTAQVRQPVTTLGYGQRVAVIARAGDQVHVRSEAGADGWVDQRLLMDATQWQAVAALLARARRLPQQAVGHTRVLSNVHADPGRNTPRIFQFGRNVPLAVLERKVVPYTPGNESDSDERAASEGSTSLPKPEDWFFVLADRTQAGNATPEMSNSTNTPPPSPVSTNPVASYAAFPIAGWVLARFVTLDPPPPIPDYSNAAGTRVVAWAVLNTVSDAEGEKPQYLVASTRAAEGQECDFTTLRAYTWGATRQRYETAYVESNLCGQLPITAKRTSDGAEFRFAELGEKTGQRVYLMRQTVIRRVRPTDAGSPSAGGR